MKKIRGVNLGGWFVLERWMKPALFEGVSGPDETVFCLEADQAKEKLETHWQTFITEKDFADLQQLGINSVRIPIPWWGFSDGTVYYSALPYIEQAMHWAEQYDLKVLLDLHTAPGCQNGFDNGGITGVIDWPNKEENIGLTLMVLEKITDHFKDYKALWGIEVLNEPHWTIDISLLQSFYKRAYEIIRTHSSDVVIVFHDGFRATDERWKPFFTTNQLKNVAFDLHLYHCFEERFNDATIHEHVNAAFERGKELIAPIQEWVDVIVGEWSLGLHDQVIEGLDEFNQANALRLLANAQLMAYENGWGWYFWSYKIERESHLGWDFSRLVKANILPSHY